MYDAAAVGFEEYIFYPPLQRGGTNDTLSPMGTMLAGVVGWAADNPPHTRGVHTTTTAFLLDYYAGWETPCTLLVVVCVMASLGAARVGKEGGTSLA
jgi:hypothetical protein